MDETVTSPDLCARCQTIDLGKYLLSDNGIGSVELGYFQDILRNKHCLLCKLVIRTLSFGAVLGESYLWVDTLCIVQDDADSKDRYISRMDRVYGQALLTIIALSGHDANASLPGVVAGSRKAAHSPVQLGPFKLHAGLPSLASVEQSSTWSSRAWTFQEGILSKRCLYFWDHQVYWQCASTYRAENIIGEIREERIGLGRLSPLERNTCNNSRRQFLSYEALGKMYSQRRLTYPSDSLKAFCGVLSAVKKSFGWEFASALPEIFFDLALLWRPMVGSRQKRVSSEPSIAGSQPPDCYLPTWCWTAWTSFIHWDAWRLGCYVGKPVRLSSEVADYFVKDENGFRRLVRRESFDQGREANRDTSLQLADLTERMPYDRALPLNTLVFEAASLTIGAYTLSAPRPESSWTLARPVSHQFKNAVRRQLWIYNDLGHHCGTIEGLRSWDPSVNTSYDFVLLSRTDQDKVTQADVDNHQDQLPPEYYSAEEYYEEVFDTKHFQYQRWWALNILLIQRKGEITERVGVRLMHVDAWNTARQRKEMIILQ